MIEPVRRWSEERERWAGALQDGLVAGTVAGVLSSVALAWAGRRQSGSAAAPLNAASHWLWGDEALREDRATWKYTLPGFLTQHAASVLWATLYARAWGHRPESRNWPQALAGGAATSATAYVIDYTVTPQRFTPGYEHRLRGTGMLAVYATLALGFALGARMRR